MNKNTLEKTLILAEHGIRPLDTAPAFGRIRKYIQFLESEIAELKKQKQAFHDCIAKHVKAIKGTNI